jgi:hypothetical protein
MIKLAPGFFGAALLEIKKSLKIISLRTDND